MKRLLRTGWIRSGVPKCDIESLADHSWSVTTLTYFFTIEENALRANIQERSPLNVEKAVLIALFHDFIESEYLDIDKSLYNLASVDIIEPFLKDLEDGALNNIIEKSNPIIGSSLNSLMRDKECPEYRIVRVADSVDLLIQAENYAQKHWINDKDAESFRKHALNSLKENLKEFIFLKSFLEREGF